MGLQIGKGQFRLDQEVIYFDHMRGRHICNWYNQNYGKEHYNYLTVSDILHWWYVYDELFIVERIIIGDGKVYYPNEDTIVATYKPNKDLGMPIFNFIDNYRNLNDMQRIYIKGLILERNNKKS